MLSVATQRHLPFLTRSLLLTWVALAGLGLPSVARALEPDGETTRTLLRFTPTNAPRYGIRKDTPWQKIRPLSVKRLPEGVEKSGLLYGWLYLGESDEIGWVYAWQTATHRLFVDLDRDGFPGGDPGEVFEDGKNWRSSEYQEFGPVPLQQEIEGLVVPYRVSVRLFLDRDSRFFYTRSGWVGSMRLAGRQWRIAVAKIPSDGGPWYPEPDRFEITPEQEFGAVSKTRLRSAPDSIAFGREVYGFEYRFVETKGDIAVEVTATRRHPTTGTLRIAGHFVQRLSLSGGEVIVLRPSRNVVVPVGTYHICEADVYNPRIVDAAAAPERFVYTTRFVTKLEIREGETTTLLVGGPLVGRATVDGEGGRLYIGCHTVGRDGRVYYPPRGGAPPDFAVMQGGEVLTTGTMEYG